MKEVVIFGAKEFEKRLKHYIENYTNDKVVAFCVDPQYRTESEFCEIPVIGSDVVSKEYPSDKYEILVGIGYKNMNELRKQKSIWAKGEGYHLYNLVHSTAFIDKTVSMGEGNIILGGVFIDYKSQIGDGNIIEIGSNISHECRIGNYNYLSPRTVLGGKVKLGDNNFAGINSVLRSNINVSNYALLGASSYTDKDVDPESVIVPARSIKLNKKSFEMKLLYQGGKEWSEF